MSLLRRYPWFAVAAGITLAFTVVCVTAHRGPALTAFADLTELAMLLAVAGLAAANAWVCPRPQRSFWLLMFLGFLLWAVNGAAWSVFEIVLHRPIPDPFVFDIVLFFHAVPMFAAVAWRPDLLSRDDKVRMGVLNFLMLLGWWIFLYAFLVFPHQYVVLNVPTYNLYYDHLYGLENGLLLLVLAIAASTSSREWRRLYLNYLIPLALYAVNSQFLDRATANSTYYSGSLYDVPLVATLGWLAAASLAARRWDLPSAKFNLAPGWRKVVPRLAMLAILSLPVLGIWAALFDHSPGPSRAFRIYTVLAAMVLLGTFVFLRQYLQDQALISLLRESRRAYDSQKQLQTQLVQKEKLASLGNLVAGAAHEINYPLNAVMSYSEELWTNERLNEEQNNLLRKMVNQACRTRDLVANLLSFAQQAPGEKTLVDLGVLLKRATQMLETRRPPVKIDIHLAVESDFPQVFANPNQLFQAFVEIIENAMDALEEAGGGSLNVTAMRDKADVVLQFSDTGPGLRDPERVFDPFYTTKAVGKGTGLGLSAAWGFIQDHNGQITCRNKPEGGALFIVRLPATVQPAAQSAGAAG
ncbi:MAG TPA: HAMP domain-containing sensor histidine kinase [Candidatus Sulfotelmatobacter sp.]|nr:HAMP domain-containing sensor histidine kinase [Candidatus Sulfotelmatobacter sp.]